MEELSYLRFILSLVLVIGLILGVGALARRLGWINRSLAPKGKRLAILEVLVVDNRRRLVLCRRDDTQHLLLIGGEGDLLIETLKPLRDET